MDGRYPQTRNEAGGFADSLASVHSDRPREDHESTIPGSLKKAAKAVTNAAKAAKKTVKKAPKKATKKAKKSLQNKAKENESKRPERI